MTAAVRLAAIVFLATAGAALGGCSQYLPEWETYAEWRQDGLYDEFPPDGEHGEFEVHTDASSVGTRKIARADDYEGTQSLRLGINLESNLTSLSVRNRGGALSQERTWQLLDQAFIDLDLGTPTLDRNHTWEWYNVGM